MSALIKALEALEISAHGSLQTDGDIKYIRDVCTEAHAELKAYIEGIDVKELESYPCDAVRHLLEGIKDD